MLTALRHLVKVVVSARWSETMHLSNREHGGKILFWCLIFCITFVIIAKITWMTMEPLGGISKSCYQKPDCWHPYWSLQNASVKAEVVHSYENYIAPA